MAAQRRGSRLRTSLLAEAVLALLLVASARFLTFVQIGANHPPLARSAYNGYRLAPKVAAGRTAAAQVGNDLEPVLLQKVEDLKTQLKKKNAVETVTALENVWNPALGVIWSLSDLEGTWVMHNPSNDAAGWRSGDALRLIFKILESTSGKMLNFEFTSDPKLTIKSGGKADMQMDLRWGSSRDTVTVHDKLTVRGLNKLVAKPQSIYSSAMKLTVPVMLRERKLRVTYFDGDLLILRDERKVVDVFWRSNGPRQARTTAGKKQAEEASQREAALGEQVGNLTDNVQVLKERLEQQQAQNREDQAERERLEKEVLRLEQDIGLAGAREKEQTIRLDALGQIRQVIVEATETQLKKLTGQEESNTQLTAETSGLREQAIETAEQLDRSETLEASLRDQIKVLKDQLRKGPREQKVAYKAAIQKANGELKEVRVQLLQAKKSSAALKAELAKKQRDLQVGAKVAGDEASARRELEKQLEEREREVAEQNVELTKVAEARAALVEELQEAHRQLGDMQARETASRDQATAVQHELESMMTEAKEAQDLGQQLYEEPAEERKPWWKLR
eukprot:TRINITY_DN74964_c0_g1_i1.p1 TRINITY_DN74964_c0_g1~~TRINITY_DN74964_c0_g1_i1.p1  ORF type:complete len:564 (-),score=199.41 TRINITY_DN74964_c0_g1_i1:352-2043(-)